MSLFGYVWLTQGDIAVPLVDQVLAAGSGQ
jgi:hypothetical protein